MSEIKSIRYKVLLLRLGIVFIAFEICRLLFVLFNYRHLSSPGLGEIMLCLIYGLRFDVPVILLFNLPFIVLHFFSHAFSSKNRYRLTLKVLFLVVNVLLVFCNVVDVFLFQFTLSRASQAELFIFETREPMDKISVSVLQTYWYGFVLLFLLFYALGKLYSMIAHHTTEMPFKKREPLLLMLCVFCVLVLFLATFVISPAPNMVAEKLVGSRKAPVLLNTPLTFFFDEHQQPAIISDIDFERNEKIYSTEKSFAAKDSFKRMNVVVILLESFSAQYVGALYGGNGFTPFLDSLAANSLLLTNCYANGKMSIQGIPAVLSSLPSWSYSPFLGSEYSHNATNSFASLLKPLGYSSAFFHGGKNGSMNFDLYAQQAGYQKYYGMTEFPNAENIDGTWGIDDEPFMQFAKQKMDSMRQPFHTAVFTLSSHHPFHVPESAKAKLPKGEDPMTSTVYYTDYAMRKFFEEAAKSSWYKNTIFVFCADHAGPYQRKKQHSEEENYHIFAMLYSPSENLKGRFESTCQQTDLLPSVLQHLNYTGKMVAFGNSIFDATQKRISVHTMNGTYTLVDSVFNIQYNNGWENFCAYGKECSNQKSKQKEDEQLLNALIQNYNYRLKNNRLTTEK